MADQKISELTELAAGNVANDDELAIVDTDAVATKRWTWASIKSDIASWFNSAVATLTNKTIDADNNTITNIGTTELSDEGVTLAKMAHIATNRILGRSTAGTGDVESLTAAQARATIDVDQAGTDNSTDVTLSGTGTYLTLVGQDIQVDPITESDISDYDPASQEMARVAGSTYSTIQHAQDVFHSAGQTSGGAITDAGGGNIDVALGTGLIRATDSSVAQLLYFDWAASTGNAIPSDSIRYVGVEYNAGAPQVVIKSSYVWDGNTEFPLGKVVNEGGTLYIENAPERVGDHAARMINRAYETMPLARDKRSGGLIISETGTRNIQMTAGAIWDRLSRFTLAAIDTSGLGTFDRYYRDGIGGWTKQASQTQWNNTQYDDGSGTLATMTNNRWSTQYFYVTVNDNLVSLYGQSEYTSEAAAELDSPPSTTPDRLLEGVLIGRIIFQKSAATAEKVESAFETTFAGAVVTDHGLLGGLTDDDHTQYTLADGTRAFTGDIDLGTNAITNVGNVDGRDVSADGTKLDGIEAGADVTDTANVTAAGALMDSELTDLTAVKTLSAPDNTTISTFGATLVDDADAATARTTLNVDVAGTDNSTDVTLAGTPNYLTLSGQEITLTKLDISDDTNLIAGTGLDLSTNTLAIDSTVATLTGSQTLTNKTIDFDNNDIDSFPVVIGIAVSDETTDLTTGTAKATFRMPYAMTLTDVRANVNTAPVGATIEVDINESGTTVLSTVISIDASEKTSETAATAPVISDSALADDAEITIDIDQVGSSTKGKGLKVWLIGVRDNL